MRPVCNLSGLVHYFLKYVHIRWMLCTCSSKYLSSSLLYVTWHIIRYHHHPPPPKKKYRKERKRGIIIMLCTDKIVEQRAKVMWRFKCSSVLCWVTKNNNRSPMCVCVWCVNCSKKRTQCFHRSWLCCFPSYFILCLVDWVLSAMCAFVCVCECVCVCISFVTWKGNDSLNCENQTVRTFH